MMIFILILKLNQIHLHLHKDIIPLQKNFYINFDISNYKEDD